MMQLVAVATGNGWQPLQASAFICHAFGVTADTVMTKFLWKDWEAAIRVFSRPENANGVVVVKGDGSPLPAERQWRAK